MKAVFFDRDGIVNVPPPEGEYVLKRTDFKLMPPFPDVLRLVTELGYAALVVSNQRCIARGLVAPETVENIHAAMREQLRKQGLSFLEVIYCPHDPGECDCRKPLPGMLLQAARCHGIDLKSSWMIGDRMTDIEAGRRAGCRTILVNPSPPTVPGLAPCRPDHVCDDLVQLRLRLADWLEF